MLKKLQQLMQQSLTPQQQPSLQPIDNLSAEQGLSLILMTEIALADGEFSTEEEKHLLDELSNDYQLTGPQAETALKQAVSEVKEAASLQHFTSPLKDLDYQTKVDLLENLWRLAYADNKLDPHEESMLRKLSDLLYISHADYIKTKLRVTENL
ncbi:MAG: TerB family tellurite resistance protein [Pseudomonadota bacterium]